MEKNAVAAGQGVESSTHFGGVRVRPHSRLEVKAVGQVQGGPGGRERFRIDGHRHI